ncbi:Acetyltransferase (GNAT) domain-containing protein [Desulfoluna spongiiphila]|uniref:Acetyltransferase (GNAT) domain-containing protein n=2 Tax=Desulfoluna spongiiphila TaxID=419481 RepID=A0A1G5JNA5_9BACT|nr:Acetyltransferase (GNAT) domain-containing protein [Desulfoluna spongiiphila]
MLSPAGTFGGWISTDILSLEHGQLITDYFTKSTNPFNGFTWRINPYDDIVQQCSFQNVDVKFDSTQVLNIACGFDKIVKNWTKGHRSTTRKARKARKEGVSIRVADSRHDWLQYFKIYEASIERWGKKASSNYKWTLFDTICKLSSPNVKLWLAEHDNEIIAGALCFYGKKQVVYWHGAALSTYFKFRPVNLLMYEAINDACKEGYSWFDFNPSGGHQGVQAFKKSFGTQERPCAVITLNSSIMRLVIARKNKKRKRL